MNTGHSEALSATSQLLRCHVGRCSSHFSFGPIFGQRGQAKVGNPHLAPTVNHNIGGLQVAVQDTFVVRGGQSGTQLPSNLDSLVFWQPADSTQQHTQVFAVDVLHREKLLLVDFTDVVHSADIGVTDLPRQPDFGKEILQSLQVVAKLFWQKLERDGVS